MSWCRRQGIEPVAAERRSLQWWRRRFRTAAAAIVFALLLPAAGQAGIYACFSCEKCYDIGAETAGAALLACKTVARDNSMAHYGVAFVAGQEAGVPCAQLALTPGAGVASYQSTFRLGPAREVLCTEGVPAAGLVTIAPAPAGVVRANMPGKSKGKT